MKILGWSTIATTLVSLILGWFAVTTILAEKLSPKAPNLSLSVALSNPASYGQVSDLATELAPMRGDLIGDNAIAFAAQALNAKPSTVSGEPSAIQRRAISAARKALSTAPHLSRVWLVLAKLQNDSEQSKSEALKMSYLTAPGDASLLPLRLAIAATTPLIDDDVTSLVRRDIRAILATRPDLRPAIIDAFNFGSRQGKAYIKDTVKSIDPTFAATLGS
jgi:hypothetical protein